MTGSEHLLEVCPVCKRSTVGFCYRDDCTSVGQIETVKTLADGIKATQKPGSGITAEQLIEASGRKPKPQGGSANCNDPDPTNVKPFSLPTLSIIIGGQPPSRNPYKYSPWFFAEYFRGDKYSRRSLTLILPFFELRIY